MIDRICQVTCPLPEESPYSPADFPRAIADLAGRGISPDTFHREDRDRFATLAACSPAQVSFFLDLRINLSRQIGQMPTQQIADNLRRLHDRAYRYDALSRTMDVADDRAKRTLDLWIAAIDHRAFGNEAFLNRILERPTEHGACLAGEEPEGKRSEASREIEMILNSTNHNPPDQGTLPSRESLISDEMEEGYTREESELLAGLAVPSTTASRLDDYQKRNELLARFRDSYREFLETPLTKRFIPERSDLYNGWTWIFTRARMQGIPVTIEEIERIRREVQREVGVQTSGLMTWNQFMKRDSDVPLFVRPDELGGMSLAAGSCVEPFAVSSRMTINGRPLSELVRENVEFIAILPHAPPRVVGAYPLFGVVVLDGSTWIATRKRVPSPGYFFEILAHEAVGHQFFARTVFNEHPTWNTRKAVHELYSYNVTRLAQDAYRETGCALPSEQLFLQRSAAQIDYLIRTTNRRLGLDPNERGLRLTDPHWEGRPPEFFRFQPHDEVKNFLK